MSVIYALIPVAILFVILAVVIFFWAVKSNQFEDIEREGMRILLDDDEEQTQQQQQQQSANKKADDESKH
ncbi:MAG: cbb3-type cytochrome oxidase assembly protein CcoS [Idiomarina sp.]|uniref:cbb3-type cytochrome oxidase assembly protein CcoS n=1 Tax=Idiomarina sp. TaxID=1874361 RepID=UPI000C6A59F6|nr:cbb3-type cytochrome oxidase assembly protein CcoS [Idiomarina sp.]MBT41715.1 cbb3-type cytochrome oxidase assembly protein CcoS [Idiomarina sp.]